MCRQAKIEIPRSVGIPKAGQTVAIATLAKIEGRFGLRLGVIALRSVAEPYRTVAGALRAPFFEGAARYISEFAEPAWEAAIACF
jgi:hypothetical protein